jgi:subtilisin-like proprotein convertase family protein
VNLNGTWTLYVLDLAVGNRGVIAGGWSLQYTQGVTVPSQQTNVRLPATGTGPGVAAAYPITFDLSTALPDAMVRNLTFSLTFQHTFPDDMRLVLQSPAGPAVVLMANAGGSGDVNGLVIFGDTGTLIPDSGPISGFHRPGSVYESNISVPAPAPTSGYQLAFAAFNGEPIRGIWKLWAYDDNSSDFGTLTSAELNIATGGHTTSALIAADPTSTQPFTRVVGSGPIGNAGPFSVTWRVSQAGTVFDAGAFVPPDFVADVPVRKGTNTIEYFADDGGAFYSTGSSTLNVNEFTYSFAEGATGGFFTTDIALANPTSTDAPVTFDFLPEGGAPVTTTRAVNALAPLTLTLNPLVPNAAVSTVVHSTSGVPLAAERTMIWDSTGYGGHGGSAAPPARVWLFAEGSQGYFNTYFLLANDTTTDANVTIDFLMEGGGSIPYLVTVPAKRRKTIFAGEIPALVNQSFATTLISDQPIIAERAMYLPGPRVFEGGHESAGVNAASTHWFLAEGATGAFFDCFVLLSNPSMSFPAHVTLTYLLPDGQTIPQSIVIPALARYTINIATVDPRLASADVSTTIVSDIGIVAERAMYWPNGPGGWHEGHNSFGITETGLHWGLADGRMGGPRAYQTYILLANPNPYPAEVLVRFLKPGVNVTRTYTLNAHSRQSLSANAEAAALGEGAFGVDIQVLNYQPIAVEKAMYWNSGAEVFAGGTNVTATRLPPP